MTTKQKATKPATPYPAFPLTAHNSGQWCKKIKGKRYYFGPWSFPDAALARYLSEAEQLQSGDGRPAASIADTLTVQELANQYIANRQQQVDQGLFRVVSFQAVEKTSRRLVEHFGKKTIVISLKPEAFAAFIKRHARPAGTLGPVAMNNETQRVRSIFKFGFDMGWLDVPIRFGPAFKPLNRKQHRILKAKQPKKFLEAAEIRSLLDACNHPRVEAQLWLGINCGFGNRDCGTLTTDCINFDDSKVSHARPKTGVARDNVPLWPETLDAIRAAIDSKPEPRKPEYSDLVFLTERGNAWTRERYSGPMMHEFAKLRKATGISSVGKSFYSLRHTFETIAGQTGLQVAVNYVMGHTDSTMAGNYRAFISDDNLQTVSNFVRDWLIVA